jgi:pseudouridine synthase
VYEVGTTDTTANTGPLDDESHDDSDDHDALSADAADPDDRTDRADRTERARRAQSDDDAEVRRVRLQRVLADAGIAARRQAEELITQGRVSVNGAVVATLPFFVDPSRDSIVVDGKPVPKSARATRRVYILFHKPERVLVSDADEPGSDRRTLREYVKHPGVPRLFAVGRLEYETLGLVLLTNDGDLANRLSHPRAGVAKRYEAIVKGDATPQALRALAKAMARGEKSRVRDDPRMAAKRARHPRAAPEIRVINAAKGRTTLEIIAKDERHLDLRGALLAAGLSPKRLTRTHWGPLALTALPLGNWRELTRVEVHQLKKAYGKAVRGVAVGGVAPSQRPDAFDDHHPHAHPHADVPRDPARTAPADRAPSRGWSVDANATPRPANQRANQPAGLARKAPPTPPKNEDDAPMTRSGPAFAPSDPPRRAARDPRPTRDPVPQNSRTGVARSKVQSGNATSRPPVSRPPVSLPPGSGPTKPARPASGPGPRSVPKAQSGPKPSAGGNRGTAPTRTAPARGNPTNPPGATFKPRVIS